MSRHLLNTRLLARPLNPNERQAARRSFARLRKQYAENPADAALPLANQLMNLDEVLNQ